MRDKSAIKIGRVDFLPMRPTPRPQLGGRRPPQGPNGSRRWNALIRFQMPRRSLPLRDWLGLCGAIGIGVAIAATTLGAVAVGQPASSSLPNLSGTYRCEGDAAACGRSGSTFTLTQSGSDLQIKNEKGDVGDGKLTSNISLSAGPIWNMLGVISSADNRAIAWSNGTTWRKQ
jgi:hypothetical protein